MPRPQGGVVFEGEIAPFAVPPRFYDRIEEDNGPREKQSMEALGRLRPYFDRRLGTVTVGNSCSLTDGAVALILMEEERAKALGLRPLGRLRGLQLFRCRLQLACLYNEYALLAETVG